MNKIATVAGTHPNFIKITQFKKKGEQLFPGGFEIQIIHTRQHYDHKMADTFLISLI